MYASKEREGEKERESRPYVWSCRSLSSPPPSCRPETEEPKRAIGNSRHSRRSLITDTACLPSASSLAPPAFGIPETSPFSSLFVMASSRRKRCHNFENAGNHERVIVQANKFIYWSEHQAAV